MLTAVETAKAVAAGKSSAVEQLEECFARVDRMNPALNAVIWQDRDGAMKEAKARDAETAKGKSRGPLHGVPVTVKESFNLKGAPTTWGVPAFKDNIAKTDSDAVSRLRAAGAIVFGKTNVPKRLIEWQSFNEIYGSTSNPWDQTRTSGGSSGGSAVAVATGMSALEVGSDIGSSIRNPAHYNGIFGLKPSWNLVSQDGQELSPWHGDVDIAVSGPIARSAGDLALGLDVLAGPTRFDASLWKAAGPADKRAKLEEFTVAMMLDDSSSPVDKAYLAALSEFGDKLEAAGAKVLRGPLPDIDHEAHFTMYLQMLGAALSIGVSDEEAEAVNAPFKDAPDDVKRVGGTRMSGMLLSHRAWLDLDNRRRKARIAFDEFFADGVDLIIAPVAAGAAFVKNEEGERPFRRIPVNNTEQVENMQLFWSGYSGVVGIPSAVGPMSQIDGLPVGYQAIGGHGRDRTCLAFAAAAEREIRGYTPPPIV